jgi:hypothetical protein
MKTVDTLPEAMRAQITDRASAESFLRALKAEGLDYHFDDGALDCLYRNGATDVECAKFIGNQVDACYDAWRESGADLYVDCPIGFILKLMDEAGELPDGALERAAS